MAGFNPLKRLRIQTSLLLFANTEYFKASFINRLLHLTNNIKHVNLAEFLKRCLKTGQSIRTGTWFLVTAVTMFKVFNCR